MLVDEISAAQRLVRTDAYQMSIGEVVSMYDQNEIVINPDFQRLFRWTITQKSRLIESLLLGIPIPSIFVFERDDGKWELVDGLQRVSTILEFMGKLRRAEGGAQSPSVLEATKYLPSLRNSVWERSPAIEGVSEEEQNPIDKAHQLQIRRARLGVEILKRPSDDNTKYDLFQRLNAGGTQANPQELRNCIMLMVNRGFYSLIKRAAESEEFQTVFRISEEQVERQRHMEYAVRFLVHTLVPYDGTLDVEEYIDQGIVSLSNGEEFRRQRSGAVDLIGSTFHLLNAAAGADALRRFENGRYVGKVGFVGLEGIAVGVGRNISEILELESPAEFILGRMRSFWMNPETTSFTSPGLRGTIRIQRTVPFGAAWFRP